MDDTTAPRSEAQILPIAPWWKPGLLHVAEDRTIRTEQRVTDLDLIPGISPSRHLRDPRRAAVVLDRSHPLSPESIRSNMTSGSLAAALRSRPHSRSTNKESVSAVNQSTDGGTGRNFNANFKSREGTGGNWRELEGTGRNWRELDGTGWNWMELEGTGGSWKELEGTGGNWMELDGTGGNWMELDGTGGNWKELEGAGRNWRELEGAGGNWRELDGTGGNWRELVAQETKLLGFKL
ncbi:unnamed protein product [Pleuronectes platessa]|uniref:Uncharacterized protein n=1 Tax=Pleuronectes platessa TaxID=8262 RepID=A0A9N7U9R8_PLEPL|nr:unnamed protein product [Pleuronectes platessa]